MMIHTGGFMTVGTVEAFVHSIKQKLNTNSSTDANLVGLDYVMSQVIWTQYFLKEQGYMIHNNVIYHEIQRVIRIEKNGKRFSSKRTRHINIRYYFITDRIIKQEAYVEFCPTLEMIGGYLTKVLQRCQFRQFRNILLGIHEDDIPAYNIPRRDLLAEQKLKFKRDKEVYQEDYKLSGN